MRKFYYIYCTLLALIFPTILLADNYVVINQVMYDAPRDELLSVFQTNDGEFIELYNAGTSAVSLQGWKLAGDGMIELYTFQDASISAGEYLIVAYQKNSLRPFYLHNLYTIPPSADISIVYQNRISLANDGETLTLYNAQNEIVDRISYDGNDYVNDPYLLHASNPDLTPGDSCVSLHRTWVEFDADGKVIIESSQWKTDYVSFGVAMLPYTSYQEEYLTGIQTLPTGENYILSISPLDPTTRIDINGDRPSVSSGIRTISNLQYYDGLGRPDESIALAINPNKKDMVTVADYYGMEHTSKQWLPVVMNTEGQRINITDIHSQAQTDYNDYRPYIETLYESSVLMRPTEQLRPGTSYANNPAVHAYDLNSENDNVRVFTVSNLNHSLYTDGSYYEEATLYKTSSADEDGNAPLTTYTDKLGRKIMEERGSSRTYYVYDDLGRLYYVLPNLSSSQLTNGTYQLTNSVLKAIAYCYRYNKNGDITYKRLPGCDPQYMVYDRTGQLILSQDGNQRENDKWTLYAYDSIGRNLYTAEIESSILPMNMHNAYANVWQVEHYVGNQSGAIPGVGYTCTAYGASNPRMLTVNYYDNYGYMSLLESEEQTRLGFVQESGYGRPCDNAVGRLTGTRIYNLSEAGSTITVYYYDIKGRVVQTRGTRNAGGYVTTSTEYLFDGSVAQQLIIQGLDTALVREHYRYTYDHAGRAKNTYYQLNDGTEITLSAFSYDSIGRLAQNLLHNNSDTVSYLYDMRNMLTEINNKHFSEKLYYADDFSTSMQSVTKCHNGNIAAARTTYNGHSETYAYSYDSQNRLRNSYYMMKSRLRDSESFRYDNAGNILRLERYKGTRLIDDLAYTYSNDGHQLLSITDYGQDADLSTVIEYHDSLIHIPPTFSSMGYDANGNLTYDVDRNIVAISYNILNLPDTIQFGNGNQIVNLYDAAGRKYKSIAYTNISTTMPSVYQVVHYTLNSSSVDYHVTEYAGSVENHYMHTDTTQRIHNAIGYYTDGTYYHYLKDHLGNICSVVNSSNNAVIQKIQYYASGVPMQSNTLGVQPYLYNGKELVTAHGLNEYDSEARMYYATIMRTTTMDPHTENNYHISPYAWCSNNPINRIDPNGLDDIFDEEGKFLYHIDNSTDYIKIENSNGNQQNITDLSYGENDVSNREMLGNVATYYASKIGLSQEITVEDYRQEYEGSVAATDLEICQVSMVVVEGRISPEANTSNNIMNALIHESVHVENGIIGPIAEVEAIVKQITHPTWSKTTESFQNGIMGYLVNNANKYLMNMEDKQKYLNVQTLINSIMPILDNSRVSLYLYNNEYSIFYNIY